MAKKIKVAYLDYSPHFAGAERALCTIISYLDRTRFEPVIIFPYPRQHHSRYENLECRIIYLCDGVKWWMGSDRWKNPMRGTDFLKRTVFGGRLARFLKREGIGILHVNLLRPDCLMWLYAAKRSGVKIVGHFRSLPMSWVPSATVQRQCDCILSVSKIVREHAMTKYAHPWNVVVYDSVPELHINKSFQRQPVLSSVAALFPNKGHDNAIRAFAKIASRYPSYELYIVGGGSNNEIKRLENIAKSEGVSPKVKFTRKQVSDVACVYASSTLVLSLTKEGEAFGLVPFEAAMCGTPTIAPDKGAIKEILTDGVSAILVETEDVDAIAGKIDWALQNMPMCKSICDKTRTIACTKLTPTEMVYQIMNIYYKLSNSNLS